MENRFKVSLIIAAAALVFSIIFLKPLLIAVLTSFVLSYIFYPVYKKLHSILKRKSISSFIVIALIIVILIVPSFFVVNALSREVFASYINLKQSFSAEGECNTVTCLMINALPLSQIDSSVRALIEDGIGKVTAYIFTQLSNIIISIPSRLFHFFLIMILSYYLLKDGEKLVKKVKSLVLVNKSHQEAIAARVNEVTRAVIFGTIIIALAQGILATIGFYLAGVSSPITWGIVTMVTSLIPFLGAFSVWFPLAVILFFNGYIANDPTVMFKAIGLTAYGFLVISSIDNILKPKIISENIKIHPALILLGVVGGISLFGVIGVIIGPLFLALTETVISLLEKEKNLS